MPSVFIAYDFFIGGPLVDNLYAVTRRPPADYTISWPGAPNGRTHGDIWRHIVKHGIEHCDRMLAFVDLPNANVGFEVGYGLGLGKRVALAVTSERRPAWLGRPPINGLLIAPLETPDEIRQAIRASEDWNYLPEPPVAGQEVLVLCPDRGGAALLEEIPKDWDWRRLEPSGWGLYDLPEKLAGVGLVVWVINHHNQTATERDGAENAALSVVAGYAATLPHVQVKILWHQKARDVADVVTARRPFDNPDVFLRELTSIKEAWDAACLKRSAPGSTSDNIEHHQEAVQREEQEAAEQDRQAIAYREQQEAEERARVAERQAQQEAALRKRQETEALARQETLLREKQEAAALARQQEEQRAKEAERREAEEAENRARQQVAQWAQQEAANRAREEEEQRAKEAERRETAAAARRAKQEEELAKQAAARREKQEAEAQARQEAAFREKQAAENKLKEEQEVREKLNAEQRAAQHKLEAELQAAAAREARTEQVRRWKKLALILIVVVGLGVLAKKALIPDEPLVESTSADEEMVDSAAVAPIPDADAMTRKGNDYYFGTNGITQNYDSAVAWYRKAADQGDATGQSNLGLMYELGKYGLPKDEAQAVAWYSKAAAHDDAFGQANLGRMYELGKGGLPKDETKAVELYQKSADQGDATGQACLGLMYELGKGGLPRDEAQAVEWYRKAADHDDAIGQAYLGDMYENGKGGLAVDSNEAVRLYRLAADQGNQYAKDALRRLNKSEQ